jgi:hypothetical protein
MISITEQINLLVKQIQVETNEKKKASLKRQLAKLLNKLKDRKPRVRSALGRHREINTGIIEGVEKLTGPILQQYKTETDRYKELIEDTQDAIEELEKLRDQAKLNGDRGLQKEIEDKIDNEAYAREAIDNAYQNNVPVDEVYNHLTKLSSIKSGDDASFRAFIEPEFKRNPLSSSLGKAVGYYKPELRGPKKQKERREFLEAYRQGLQNPPPSEEVPPPLEQKEDQSNATAIPAGEGKRKRKVKGGAAGIEDWLSVLGNIPGGSQALGLIPVVGPMASVLGSLGQSGAKVGSEIGKQATGNPEKMSLSGLSGLKGIFGFGKGRKSKGCGVVNNIQDFEGAGLGDLFSGIGGLTGPLSGLIGKLPGAYGQLGSLGNSQVGSASRVFGDVFGKMGMGKRKRKGGSTTAEDIKMLEGAGLGDFLKQHKGKLLAGTAGLAGLAGLAKKVADYAPLLSAMKGSGRKRKAIEYNIADIEGGNKFTDFISKHKGKLLAGTVGLAGLAGLAKKVADYAPLLSAMSNAKGAGRWTAENNFQPPGRLHQSFMENEKDIQNIVANRLTKAKDEAKAVKDFNRELNQKQNVDTQNAVLQLQYAKLIHDVGLIKEEERKRKRKAAKKGQE